MENALPSTHAGASPSPMVPLQKAIRVVLADDERLAREKLRLLLASEPGIEIVAESGDGAQAVSAILQHQSDMAMLDVQMPGMDGFQVLSQFSADEMLVVIVATAYDQYALRAFEAN